MRVPNVWRKQWNVIGLSPRETREAGPVERRVEGVRGARRSSRRLRPSSWAGSDAEGLPRPLRRRVEASYYSSCQPRRPARRRARQATRPVSAARTSPYAFATCVERPPTVEVAALGSRAQSTDPPATPREHLIRLLLCRRYGALFGDQRIGCCSWGSRSMHNPPDLAFLSGTQPLLTV
jgi:hypothetical protein